MTVIEALRAWLLTCPYIAGNANEIQIEYPDVSPTSYGLASSGAQTVKTYLGGSRVVEHNFVLYANNYTIEDAARLENSGFFESFDGWLYAQNIAQSFPVATGISFDAISCANGMLYDLAENGDTGTYQIQIKAIYTKEN